MHSWQFNCLRVRNNVYILLILWLKLWKCHILTLCHVDTVIFWHNHIWHCDKMTLWLFDTVTLWHYQILTKSHCDILTLTLTLYKCRAALPCLSCTVLYRCTAALACLSCTVLYRCTAALVCLSWWLTSPSPSPAGHWLDWLLDTSILPGNNIFSVQCIVYSGQCIVYNVQCILYSVQCTVYSV